MEVCANRNNESSKSLVMEPGLSLLQQMVRSGNMRCVFYCSQNLAIRSLQDALNNYEKKPAKPIAEEILSGILLILNCQVGLLPFANSGCLF